MVQKKWRDDMKVEIGSYYSMCLCSEYELPEGKTPEDIEFIDKKWKSMGIHFHDGTCLEVIDEELFDHQLNDELKRPYKLQLLNDGYWDKEFYDGDEC